VGWVSGIVVYVIIWWIVMFMALPVGIRREENPETGHDPAAPANPMLWRKAAATTVIAAVLWAIVYWVISADLISFRYPA
jgi:predicted secreted protein